MLEQKMSLANCQDRNTCAPYFNALIEVLKKEINIFQELKNVITAEKKILIKPSLEELNHSNAIKENIILKARMLEEVRLNIFKKIARKLDMNESGIKIRELAEYAEADQAKEMNEVAEELAALSRDINALNETNKGLLDVSLATVNNSLDFIISLMSSESVYLETGQVKIMQSNGKFLRTEG